MQVSIPLRSDFNAFAAFILVRSGSVSIPLRSDFNAAMYAGDTENSVVSIPLRSDFNAQFTSCKITSDPGFNPSKV